MNGLILGRFQIFHKGHESLIEDAFSYCDKILIFIGSSDKKGTKENPFSYHLRKKMIKSIYGNKVIIKPLPDIGVGDVPQRGDYVFFNAKKYINPVDYIFYGNEIKHSLRYSEKYSKNTKFQILNRKDIPISATEIREAILKDDYEFFAKYTNPDIHKYYKKLQKILLKIEKTR